MKLALADYGVGNIHSIKKALELAGADVEVVSDMSLMADAECMVFPGVGAFDSTMERLLPYRSDVMARMDAGVPALGICIGAQIMFSGSDEGKGPGIGEFGGRVRALRTKVIPHMGWNIVKSSDPMFDGVDDMHFYFAHSYYCDPDPKDIVKGTTEYEGFEFATLMRKDNVVCTQFHPEKSSDSGLRFLRNFIDYAEGSL